MKIAITADLHLRQDYQERFSALDNLLNALKEDSIHTLFIAGDLFDREDQNYSFFDEFAKDWPEIEFFIIPGNHDPALEQKHFVARNIHVLSEPQIIRIKDVHFVVLPFRFGLSMDEVLAELFNRTPVPERWVLLAHGDYITGTRTPNPYEPGIYMPLTAQAIEKFNPVRVVLGHIHKPLGSGQLGRVFYPGSLCGLDINETGPRGYIVLQLPQLQLHWQRLSTEVIYFNEKLLVFPEDDEDTIVNRLKEIIASWPIEEEERPKVILRLEITGYCRDKRATVRVVEEFLSSEGITLYDTAPVTDALNHLSEDPFNEQRLRLLKKLKATLDSMPRQFDGMALSREDILYEAMKLIFQVR